MEKDNVVEVSEKVFEMSDKDNDDEASDIQCSYSVVVRTSAKSPCTDFGTVVIQVSHFLCVHFFTSILFEVTRKRQVII